MAYENAPVNRRDKDGDPRITRLDYNNEIAKAMSSRNNTLKDTDPMVEKEGFLAVDNLDKLRRRKLVVSN
jgi:hypothetical protein